MVIGDELRKLCINPIICAGKWWEIFYRVIGDDHIDTVLTLTGTQEKRKRKLPAKIMMMLTIAMNIFTEESIPDVFATMTEGIRLRHPELDDDLPKKGLFVRQDIDWVLLR